MTEADWLTGTDPVALVKFVTERVSSRRKRLLGVACCRRIWALLTDERSRRAVAVAERYADGRADYPELAAADLAADLARSAARRAALAGGSGGDSGRAAAAYAAAAAQAMVHGFVTETLEAAQAAVLHAGGDAEWLAQCRLVREVFGNPFRAVTVDPGWLTANGGVALKLARAAYREQAFDRLPILADTLEDAGCTSADVLGHCRDGGEHVRGCWVLDLLLNKR
jgi:hypothetical protein